MSFYTNCVMCGNEFVAERSTAKYCSEACKQRMKHYRKRKRRNLGYRLEQTKSNLYWLRDEAPDSLCEIMAVLTEIMGDEGQDWRKYKCRECGQQWVGDHPPDECDFCKRQPGYKQQRARWSVIHPTI